MLNIAGTHVGHIAELILEPESGVVRFANLRNPQGDTITLPWAALQYQPEHCRFVLTTLGEGLVPDQL